MLYAGSSFLKWNTPPARIHESVGHSEWIQSDITIWTQLEFQLNIHSRYSNWSVSEDVKQTAQMQLFENFAYLGIRRTWMRTVLEHRSFHYWFRQISKWNCLPAKHSDQGGRGERKRCSNFTIRNISREANILASINRIPIYNFCLHWSIWFHLVTGLDHSSLPLSFRFRTVAQKIPAI